MFQWVNFTKTGPGPLFFFTDKKQNKIEYNFNAYTVNKN